MGKKSVKSILYGFVPVLFEGEHREWRDSEGITGVRMEVIGDDVRAPR